MRLESQTVLVLGGWGLVGSAVCRRILQESPKRLIVTSLRRTEAEEAAADFRRLFPSVSIEAWWGDIFVRSAWKDLPRSDLLANPTTRAALIEDILSELEETRLQQSALYELLTTTRPDIVVDCINTATAIAYQDIYSAAAAVWHGLQHHEFPVEATERLLSSLYIPQLIRHIQILYHSLLAAGTRLYLKVGTTGTGGMGLNIPYTHSEERPSRVLLAKSAVAGAQSLLLFLMGRTPGAPIVKEVKPAAIIAWKRIAYDTVLFRGRPLMRVDLPPEEALELGDTLPSHPPTALRRFEEPLRSVFIDTGENGVFARAEFETVSALGQMELVTPEEIADIVVREILGGNTGHDTIAALDSAVLGPSYRGGVLRHIALEELRRLEQQHGSEGVAFEMLGPPRLTKLLYEAHLLRRAFGTLQTVLEHTPEDLAASLWNLLCRDDRLRSQILTVGLAILLPDGRHYLRGAELKVPSPEEDHRCTPEAINRWCESGWIDLRPWNMERWQARLRKMAALAQADNTDKSSAVGEWYLQWSQLQALNEGSLAAWILTYEEHGTRAKR
ncbi:MAG: short-chain dehydrogenase [Candidatus Kapabacteria bacterium]|nr:short-chain dehydrogenase [Candidatus Kapabacteria bacterium]MDW8012559.1 short-chain dehydrogenase [Bacteroidota bacterium]